jgi:drug/metabolite transporter (DMT)-like permease
VSDNLRGILAVLVASAAFVVNDAFVKLLSADLPSGEILILRGIIATALLFAVTALMGAMRPLSVLATPMMAFRLLAAGAATTFIVISLRYAPLATVNAVVQATPLLVTAGAAVVYGEKVGLRRWLAALAGFLGVLLIVRPDTAILDVGTCVVLAALACTTMRDLTTRGLDHSIPSVFVAAASAAAITLSGLAVVPFDTSWSVPTTGAWALMGASAICQFVAHTGMIIALRTGEIAVIAPFRYVAAPLAILVGFLWWGEIPDAFAFAGIALVIAAGLYTLNRERAGSRVKPTITPQRSPAQ